MSNNKEKIVTVGQFKEYIKDLSNDIPIVVLDADTNWLLNIKLVLDEYTNELILYTDYGDIHAQ